MTTALSIALVVAWLAILREAWRTWQPTRLLAAGRYDEAVIAAERVERSWFRVFRDVRVAARLAGATARHLSGELEASLRALAPLDREGERLRGPLRYALCSVEAANLVLLARDLDRAGALLEEASRLHEAVEDTLLAAHARLGAADPVAAAALFAKASDQPLPTTEPRAAITHALRGLYLTQIGATLEARTELAIAAETSLDNVYVRRARAALELAPSDPGDPRSSLAPQVVGDE